MKQSAPADFLQAIRAVAAGGVYLDPAMTQRVADGLLAKSSGAPAPPPLAISERESEVLRLIAVGHSNKEVASQLNISVKTVEVHTMNAMRKLGLTGSVGNTRPVRLSSPIVGRQATDGSVLDGARRSHMLTAQCGQIAKQSTTASASPST